MIDVMFDYMYEVIVKTKKKHFMNKYDCRFIFPVHLFMFVNESYRYN